MPLRPIQKIRLVIGLLALALPVLALIAIILGVVLFRAEVLGLRASQLWLTVSASLGVVALLVLVVGRAAKWVALRWMLLLALPAAAPIAAGAWALDYMNRHPSTAEISTDLVDPPVFEGAQAAPFPQPLITIGRQRHGDVRSLVLPQQPPEAYARALARAETQTGWRVTASHPPETLQGTAVFGRFHYQRDWTIRIRPELSGGSLVDMRIRSRPGEPDLGDNARAVEAYLKGLKSPRSP